jgi:hypothetical protein
MLSDLAPSTVRVFWWVQTWAVGEYEEQVTPTPADLGVLYAEPFTEVCAPSGITRTRWSGYRCGQITRWNRG